MEKDKSMQNYTEASCHFELNKFDKSESCYNVLSSLVDGNNDLIFR